MHEHSLLTSLDAQIERLARTTPFDRVVHATLVCGEFSGVDPDNLRHALTHIPGHSLLHGADIEITAAKGMASCDGCGAIFAPEEWPTLCQTCGDTSVRLIAGDRLELVSLEVESRVDPSGGSVTLS